MWYGFEFFLQYCWPVMAILLMVVLLYTFISSRMSSLEFGWVSVVSLVLSIIVLAGIWECADRVADSVLALDGLMVALVGGLALLLIPMELGWIRTPLQLLRDIQYKRKSGGW